jgi:glycosyltransferase involved in cell wall biosynthesis
MHILWINEVATMTGGCEHYIVETVAHLRTLGFRSTLLYSVASETDIGFTGAFDAAFPMVDLSTQIAIMKPDVIYAHRLSDLSHLRALAECNVPVARFFHDHKLFCLREHKYTAVGHHTCTRPIGTNCYACLGFVSKSERFPGVAFHTVGALETEQDANRNFDAFVVASQYMREEIAAHGFPIDRIWVNPLYAAPIAADVPPRREPDLLMFAGQLTTGKGVDTLLYALTRTKSSPRLVICGTGKFEDEYRRLSSNLGLDPRVTFVGRLSQSELAEMYRCAACVVVPSRAPETFGLIGPEAMRFGTPLIATSVGGMNEWLRPEKTGIAVPPTDVAALAEAIDRMIQDPALRARLGAESQATYEADFRPERHVARLSQLFTTLNAKGYSN